MTAQSCQHHVALIDSGIGGFSIMNEIEQRMPGVAISYFMDNQYLPYGELSESMLLNRLENIVEFLLETSKPDLIVLACNTASTQSLAYLRQRFAHTFVGVVPAVKPAAQVSRNKQIGILATPATVNGSYIEQLILAFAEDCVIHKLGSSELVHLAEQYFWQENDIVESIVLEPLFAADTIVLGCTHFPLIKSLIAKSLPTGVELVDSGRAIANRVAALLQDIPASSHGEKQLFASKPLSAHRQQKLSQIGFDSISQAQV